DVHWAEQPLLDLVERLGRDVQGPLVLIATARPDFVEKRSAWSGRVDTETISLGPLAAESAASLVDSLLGGDFPPHVRRLVVERSEGEPVLRRGSARQPHRRGSARAGQRRVARERASAWIRDPGLGPGRACPAHRFSGP